MRVVLFGNNWLCWQAARHLAESATEVCALVLHPHAKQRYADDIIGAAGLPAERIFYGDSLHDKATIDALRAFAPELGLSVLFDYILKRDVLDVFPRGVLNLHPSYLPYNRGQYPNVWSIVEGTPAGVTLHYMDVGLDTGPIVAQEEVTVEPVDTGESLYRKLESKALDLFMAAWPGIEAGTAQPRPQSPDEGTFHRKRDVETIDEIHLDASYRAEELINILRARTFPPYSGAWFQKNGKRVGMRLELFYMDAPEQNTG